MRILIKKLNKFFHYSAELSVYHERICGYQASGEHEMPVIPSALRAQFDERLLKKAIPKKRIGHT